APDARLEARLRRAPDASGAPPDSATPLDDLSVDDRAFAVIPPASRRRVLRVGAANRFLDAALGSLGSAVDVTRTVLPPGDASGFDAVIFDGEVPGAPARAGRFLYLDPHGS